MKPVINYEGSSAAKLEDAELARRIAGQPPAAAGAEEAELCRRYARRVFHYGLRHLRNDDRARDLVQDVLLTTLQKLRAGEVKDPERIGSFILGTARLTAHSTRRAGKRQDSTELTEDVAVCESSLDADPLARDLVARCLEKLQERHRTVVVLSFYAEQSTADIAGSLGMSSNNVRVIRHRGIAQLRSCLGIEGGGLAS